MGFRIGGIFFAGAVMMVIVFSLPSKDQFRDENEQSMTIPNLPNKDCPSVSDECMNTSLQ